MGRAAPRNRSSSGQPSPLDVRLSITPLGDCICPLLDCQVSTVQQTLTGETESECTCRLVVGTDCGSTYQNVETDEFCPCPSFEDYECVTELLQVQDGSLLYSVTIPDRSVLAPLIQGLRESNASVSVTRILTAGEEDQRAPDITEKQREAFLIAVERGYYERPRGATLEDIAEELGITSSAVSQRLTAVKRRLARKYARRYEAELSE